jgi:hypothetical protein
MYCCGNTNHFSWQAGYVMFAMEKIWKATGNPVYYNYIKRYVDQQVDEHAEDEHRNEQPRAFAPGGLQFVAAPGMLCLRHITPLPFACAMHGTDAGELPSRCRSALECCVEPNCDLGVGDGKLKLSRRDHEVQKCRNHGHEGPLRGRIRLFRRVCRNCCAAAGGLRAGTGAHRHQ